MKLTSEQLERYSRQLILSDFGHEGQHKLAEARILVVGTGGLGSPALLYLAAAGVGTLGIADGDAVDLSNLQRQIIHATPDIAGTKVESAAVKINRLNPHVQVETYPLMAQVDTIDGLIASYDFVIDATDNFEAKFMINDACVQTRKAFSHAGVSQFVGQTMTIIPGRSACYRCVFDQPPPADAVPTGAQAGILGSVAGVIGCLQATEALKYVIGKGNLLTNRILKYDALEMDFRQIPILRNPDCPVCET